MSDKTTKDEIRWLIIVGVLIVILLCVGTYDFWPSGLKLLGDWP
jgi:hypothetical protein